MLFGRQAFRGWRASLLGVGCKGNGIIQTHAGWFLGTTSWLAASSFSKVPEGGPSRGALSLGVSLVGVRALEMGSFFIIDEKEVTPVHCMMEAVGSNCEPCGNR